MRTLLYSHMVVVANVYVDDISERGLGDSMSKRNKLR